jgi:hypothetical protein
MNKMIVFLLLLLVPSCGDSTGPDIRDISGLYRTVDIAAPTLCTPPAAVLSPFFPNEDTTEALVRVEQRGEEVRFTLVEVDGQNVEALDDWIAVTLDADDSWHEELPPGPVVVDSIAGRTFYMQMVSQSLSGRFDRTAQPITLTQTGMAAVVVREGSSTAPVFTTCMLSGSGSGTRTSE